MLASRLYNDANGRMGDRTNADWSQRFHRWFANTPLVFDILLRRRATTHMKGLPKDRPRGRHPSR